jgi:hypothetical protein
VGSAGHRTAASATSNARGAKQLGPSPAQRDEISLMSRHHDRQDRVTSDSGTYLFRPG